MRIFHNTTSDSPSLFLFGERRMILRAQPDYRRLQSEENLPTNYNAASTPLENRLRELESQERESPRGKISGILKGIWKSPEEETGIQLNACREQYNTLKAPITHKNIISAIQEVDDFDRTLTRFQTEGFGPRQLQGFLDSDLSPFLKPEVSDRIRKAIKKMRVGDDIYNTLNRNLHDSTFVYQAQTEWKNEYNRLKAQLTALKNEKNSLKKDKVINIEAVKLLEEQITFTKNEIKNETNWVNRRILHLEAEKENWKEESSKRNEVRKFLASDETKKCDQGYIQMLQASLASDSPIATPPPHKSIIQKEDQNLVELSDRLDHEDKIAINEVLLEAREIRFQNIRMHLWARLEESRSKFKANKNLFSEDQQKGIKKALKYPEEWFAELDSSPERASAILKDLNRGLDNIDRQLESAIQSGNATEAQRQNSPEAIKTLVLGNLAQIKRVKSQFENPETMARIREKVEQEEAKRLADGGKPSKYIHQSNLAALDEIGNPNSKTSQYIRDFEARARNIDKMSTGELELLLADSKKLLPILQGVGNFDDTLNKLESPGYIASQNAQQAISTIQSATTWEGIRDALESNDLGEHLDLVDDATFAHYRRKDGTYIDLKAMSSGQMAFYHNEDTDEFRVIINTEALLGKDGQIKPGLLDKIKKQITHELLHLQYRNNDDIREQVRLKFQEDPEQWDKILEAFKAYAKDLGRSPGDNQDWEDMAMSELYAMQNEMGQFEIIPPTTPKQELNNLLYAIGGGKVLQEIAEIDKKLEEKNEEIEKDNGEFEGYMEGAEAEAEAESGGESGGTAPTAEFGENQDKITEIMEMVSDTEKSEFLGNLPGGAKVLSAIKDHLNNTERLHERSKVLNSPPMAAGVASRLKTAEEVLNDLMKSLNEVSSKAPNMHISPLQNLWNNTTFLSLSDFIRVGKDVVEFMKRRHERKEQDHSARIGMAIFGDTALGREALARQQKAEADEVNEWKSRYENLDAWQLQVELNKMANSMFPSKDQFKAILRILADKGRIKWTDESLWKILNRLQSKVHLTPGDEALLSNPPLMSQKLHAAIGETFDYDEYPQLQRDNESSYDSNKKKYNPFIDRIQNQLTPRIEQLFKMHDAGENVDPMEFEACLEYGIEQGKSYPEAVMFYLIAGMAKGIITADRGLVLDKHLNKWPTIEWMTKHSPPLTQKKYEDICKIHFKDEYEKGEIGPKFKNFYWTEIQNTQTVKDRVRKSANERGWDHDWGRAIVCMGDANTIKTFLGGRSGQQEAKDTAVENSVAGVLQYMEENAEKMGPNWRQEYTRMMGLMAMMDGMLSRCAYSSSDIHARYNESILSKKPREAGVTNHPDWTVRQHRDKARAFMDAIDPIFFGMIRDESVESEAEKRTGEKAKRIKDYLTNKYGAVMGDTLNKITKLDSVFDNIDEIVGKIASTVDNAKFMRVIKTTFS